MRTASRQHRLRHPVARSERPRVLFLGRNLLVGGAERAFLSYVNHAHAIEPVVGLLHRQGPLLRELAGHVVIRASRDDSVPLPWRDRVVDALPGTSFARLLRECAWLGATVTADRTPVVSSFLMRAHVVALLTKRLLVPGLRVVLNVHEHMTESARYIYPKARDRGLMRAITRHLFPLADRIVVVAEELRRDLVETHGVPAGRVAVVHNAVDIARIRAAAREPFPASPAAADGRRTVVAVGRLVSLKGYDVLVRALAALDRSWGARLVIVGDGDERPALERLVTSLALRDSVTFTGWQDNPWKFVARADVLALTSYTEAFPCALTEAFAVGTPVVATDCSAGVRECVQHGACGVLVPPGDPQAIAAALERVLGNDALRESLVARGRERVAPFDLPLAVRRYESVLGEVTESSRDRPEGRLVEPGDRLERGTR